MTNNLCVLIFVSMLFIRPFFFFHIKSKIKVSHSLIAVGAVGVRVPMYLGHS